MVVICCVQNLYLLPPGLYAVPTAHKFLSAWQVSAGQREESAQALPEGKTAAYCPHSMLPLERLTAGVAHWIEQGRPDPTIWWVLLWCPGVHTHYNRNHNIHMLVRSKCIAAHPHAQYVLTLIGAVDTSPGLS